MNYVVTKSKYKQSTPKNTHEIKGGYFQSKKTYIPTAPFLFPTTTKALTVFLLPPGFIVATRFN